MSALLEAARLAGGGDTEGGEEKSKSKRPPPPPALVADVAGALLVPGLGAAGAAAAACVGPESSKRLSCCGDLALEALGAGAAAGAEGAASPSSRDSGSGLGPSMTHLLLSYFERMNDSTLLMRDDQQKLDLRTKG